MGNVTTMTGLIFRPALAADVDAAVPLIHSSGPAAFEYVFGLPGVGDAQVFLRHAFVDGAGEFGWRNHVVGELDGVVVAAGAGYGGATKWPFTLAAGRQILAHYGWRHAAGVIGRGLRVESVIPPPAGRMYYLAHLGVSPALRGRGFGAALVAYLLAIRSADAVGPVILDVATTNADAQRLYQRLGFAVVGERRSRLANAQGVVPDHRRMQWRAGHALLVRGSDDGKQGQHGQYKQDDEQEEQDLGDGAGDTGNTAKAHPAGNQRDDAKNDGPLQHEVLLQGAMMVGAL